MTYQDPSELPETLRATLPQEAQQIYIDAYNQALEDESLTPGGQLSNESAAHAIGWQAVEQEFVRKGATWYRKGETTDMPVESEGGIMEKIREFFG